MPAPYDLTVISGPQGTGKTTLAAALASQHQGPLVVLDEATDREISGHLGRSPVIAVMTSGHVSVLALARRRGLRTRVILIFDHCADSTVGLRQDPPRGS